MERFFLKEGIINEIRSKPMLLGTICDALKISTYTFPRLLKSQDQRLTQKNVLQIICEHLGTDENDILETKVIKATA